MKANYHTHTYRCNHADGTEEDYILAAIKKGLSIIGFSDHCPYKDNRLSLRMQFEELQDYIDTLKNLKEKYKDFIKILIGVEIEYSPEDESYYNYLLKDLNLDYLVLGQHVFYKNNKFYNSFELESTEDFLEYAKSISIALEKNHFSFLAHPDLIFINDFPWDSNCELASDLIIKSALKNNSILEFNVNGIRGGLKNYIDGHRYCYPHLKFWEKVSKTNLRVLINADCHSPSQIWDSDVEKAYDLAKKLNLNIIYEI